MTGSTPCGPISGNPPYLPHPHKSLYLKGSTQSYFLLQSWQANGTELANLKQISPQWVDFLINGTKLFKGRAGKWIFLQT